MHGYTILNWGDLDENGNSKEGTLVMHGQKKCIKAILTKMAIFKKGYQSRMVTELRMGAILMKINI